VHAADIQDRDGGALVIATMFGMYPFLLKLYADGGYQGPVFRRAVTKVLPKRWVVERTFAWLGRCRRLAKDWENLNRKALAFPRLASIRLMLRKLCNHVNLSGQTLRLQLKGANVYLHRGNDGL
jgi:putative transposase